MKYNFLKEFFEKNNLNTELISIYYDFEDNNKSGFFVKNLVYSGLEQYGISGANKFILKDYYPGFYETCYEKNYRPTGFGIFDGNDRLKTSKNFQSDQFNIFLNIKNYGCNSNYIDINSQNLSEPSGIYWNNLIFERTGYNSGIKFINKNSLKFFTESKQVFKLTGNHTDTAAYFGYSTSLNSNGNIAVIGAIFNDINGVSNAGSAYIFTGSGNNWVQAAKITGDDAEVSDRFGQSVSINSIGNTIIIGASDKGAGAAYIFTGNNNWNQSAKITGDSQLVPSNSKFGYSVAINSAGNIALVGAYDASPNGVVQAGSAYIFTGSGNNWVRSAKITASDAEVLDRFGYSVSLNSAGDVALIGAYNERPNGIPNAGSAYIFTGSGNNWVQAAKITGDDAGTDDLFGYSVALDAIGNTALIGCTLEDPNGIFNAGSAYIFTGSGNNWVQAAKITGDDSQASSSFGASVAINSAGNIALVGAQTNSPNSISNAGSAYIFTGSGNNWVQAAKITGNDAEVSDRFGNSVALDAFGNTALIGAYLEDSNGINDAGSAYLFTILNKQSSINISFNKTGISTNFSDWSYISGNFTGIIETGIQSKLPKYWSGQEIITTNDFLLGKAQTLINIKSLQNSSRPFDLKVGINNIYKLLIDFSGYSEENLYLSKTLTGEMANQNIISLNINRNILSLCYHDFLANKNYCEQINTTSNFFDQEIECYFGDNVGNYNKDIYTGYRGLIDDLFIISGSLNDDQKLQISKNLLKTGIYTGIQNSSNISYNLLSSGYLTTGIIGTGITGYELVEAQQVINCQDNCIFYIKSGITGYLTGEVIEYRLVQPSGASIAGENVEIDLYNSGDISNLFAKNYLIMYKPIDNKDLIEIQTYELNSNYLKDPEYSEGISGFYTENINNNKILVFFNGVNISSGYYDVINSSTFIINSYPKDENDVILYNKVPSSAIEYKFDYTGQEYIGNITYAIGQTYNIFLNGQKLINNYNYSADNRITFNGEFLTINGDYLVYTEDIIMNTGTIFDTGELYIIEDNKLNSITGSSSNLITINPDYGSNFVWLNGILQKEFEDHLFTSCNNNAIQSYIKREEKGLEIFNRENNRFNII